MYSRSKRARACRSVPPLRERHRPAVEPHVREHVLEADALAAGQFR